MILYNTRQVRVFNGNGRNKELELLLKLSKIYSLKKFIKFIKIVEIQLKINLNFNIDFLFKQSIKNFLLDLQLILNLKKNEKLKIFLLKKFLVFHFFHFFLSFFKNFFKKNEKLKIFSTVLNKGSFLSYKFQDLKPLYSNFFLPSAYLKKLNKRSIFIAGEAYDFYKGSLTPFYNSKFSWFLSTGLKSDVEVGDINLSPRGINESEKKFRSVVFRLNNFKQHVIRGRDIKKKARHLFYYGLSNFFGFQRFISESRSSYNYKLNNYSLLEQSFFYTKLKINDFLKFFKKKKKLFYLNTFFHLNFFGYNLLKIYNNKIYGSTLNIHFIKFIFILFQSSKAIINYYNETSKEIVNLAKSSIVIYRSLFSFLNLKKKYNFIFKKLFKSLFSRFSYSKLKLVQYKNIKLNLYFVNLFDILLQTFQLNFNLLYKISIYISKNSFFNIFFSIFLLRKKRQILLNSLDNDALTITEKTEIHMSLIHNPYWIFMYKSFMFYLYFFMDWKLNFDLLITKYFDNSFSFTNLIKKMQKPFKLLKIKWHLNFFINIKEFYFFIFSFLEEIIIDLKKLFFFFSLKKKNNFSKIFLFFNLYIYIYKLKNKDIQSEKMILSDIITISSFFLGKWFYYRHLQKFIDNRVNYNYSLGKSFKVLNLKPIGLRFKTLKDFHFYKKKKFWFNNKYKENRLRFFFRLKLISDLKINVYKYRHNHWGKKLTFYSNNILKRGVFFQQPIFPQKVLTGSKFWKKSEEISILFKLPKKREILAKYNKHYLSSFYKKINISFSNTFLVLYTQINIKLKKNYSYYNFWFS